MKCANIKLQLNSDLSELIYKSLEPELMSEKSNADVKIYKDESGLILTIKTQELSTLRAALNSYIRWINCIHTINNTIQTPSKDQKA